MSRRNRTNLKTMDSGVLLKVPGGDVLMPHNDNHTAEKYFYLHDRLGSVREIINTSGNVVKLYTYSPFGQTIEESSDGSLATSDGFMFAGQYYDSEIWQYYLRARQYDPYINRFTSRDPADGKFEEPLTLHKYLYCGNDPLNKVDLTGRWLGPIHDQIINAAFSDRFSNGEMRSIEQGSAYADTFQSLGDSFMHAMRAPGQSVKEAEGLMRGFIEQYLFGYEMFKSYGSSAYRELAFSCLGMAMHPVMDSTAPNHKGFQIWYGLGDPRGEWHIATERTIIFPKERRTTTTLMHKEIASFESKYCDLIEDWLGGDGYGS